MEASVSAVDVSNQIKYGDLVLLWFEKKEVSYMVEVTQGKRVSIHCGSPLAVDDWVGRQFGEKIVTPMEPGFLLKPSVDDLMFKASRESGIIYPKDAAYLMIRLGIGPGSKVLEIGTGSGSLTTAMAYAVRPHGKIWTFDRRLDLPQNAVKNIRRAGLAEFVRFEQRESQEAIPETGFDAAVLDIPTPWEEIAQVRQAMKCGAKICCLNPTFNQIEKSAEALRANGFIRVDAIELLERPILAREGKTRPVQRMVSHTEFLVFGTKVDI